MIAAPRPGLNRWTWLVAALLLLAEFLLFDRMTSLHHASLYPRWNDQIQYLRESYTAFEEAKAHGLAAGLKFALGKPALQGTLHDTAALLVFWVLGSASRSAALSLNMFLFLAWQASLLAVIPRISGSRALGWMGFGLVLCVAWPWSGEAGSAVDFRLDHGAMCLFGLTASVALLTRGFRSWRWSLLLGVVVGITLLERFLTGMYFAVIFLGWAGWILGGVDRGLRLRNLVLAGLAAAVLAGPVFWLNRVTIYNYYWVGHITGAESVARLRAMDHGQAIQFVFGNLGRMHLGSWFGWTAMGFSGLLIVLALLFHQTAKGINRDWLFTGLSFLLLPALVLAVHPQKSAYVLGVLVPGVVVLVLWSWTELFRRIDFPPASVWRRLAPAGLAALVVASGGFFFTRRQVAPAHNTAFLADDLQAKAIADYIFSTSRAKGLTHPAISVDQVVDFLDGQILQVICYERHGVWVPFEMQLPQSILEEKDEMIFYRLNLCDYVLLTDQMPGNGYWPYDRQMRRLYPELKAWCEAHRRHTQTFFLFGREMSLYERPDKS
jgi:hypothetical protein